VAEEKKSICLKSQETPNRGSPSFLDGPLVMGLPIPLARSWPLRRWSNDASWVVRGVFAEAWF